ncbi:hypothetical protein HC251_25245 (plasmid) [Iamia sp. SCSIO 61187]|uniref:ATP-binding protein n=1 Tax=Iamia sp. SCSIO 61187 TaxID=2722752 RepID=UPI001C62FAB3|nr:ATP-binding protein [Iamia sp. SCSIO 61187]QYG95857.1 hypothetical protein HC251_25245 [Iamia sp. SCSIO 61187]
MASRQAHRATTRHVASAYPAQAQPGWGARGVRIGLDVESDAAVTWDPWELYNAGIISGPHAVVVGMIGSGKSSLAKTIVARETVFRRRALIIDPKGEWGPVVDAVGGRVLRIRPPGAPGEGPPSRLNPLDPALPVGDQAALLEAIAAVVTGGLTPEEATALELAHKTALARVEAARHQAAAGEAVAPATLSDVVTAMLHPDDAAAQETAGASADELVAMSRRAALALRRLCVGPLGAMLDGPSTVAMTGDWPVLSVDLHEVVAVSDELVAIVMLIVAAWLQQIWTRADGTKWLVVLDECWRMLGHLALARWLRASAKVARQYQTAFIYVLHRYSDLAAAGEAGSEQVRVAEGLLADAETRVIYRQPDGETANLRQLAGLTSEEIRWVGGLPQGVALWRVGRRSAVVRHELTAWEAPLVDTDTGLAGLYQEAHT